MRKMIPKRQLSTNGMKPFVSFITVFALLSVPFAGADEPSTVKLVAAKQAPRFSPRNNADPDGKEYPELKCFHQSTIPPGDVRRTIGKPILCNWTNSDFSSDKVHCYKIGDSRITTRRCADAVSIERAKANKIKLTKGDKTPMCKESKMSNGDMVKECWCTADECNGSSKMGQVSFLWSIIICASVTFALTSVFSPSSTHKY